MHARAVVIAVIAVLTLWLGGCGARATSKELTDLYVGTWQISSGQDTSNCVGEAPTDVSGSVIVSLGASAGTLSVRDTNHGSCVWILKASQESATFVSGQDCAATAGVNAAQITPRDYTFVLSSNQQATVSNKFDWMILDTTCSHLEQETLEAMTVQ